LIAIREQVLDKGNKLRLSFACQGGADEEATSIIEFRVISKDLIVPDRFFFAG
jgi:hypothetical protein